MTTEPDRGVIVASLNLHCGRNRVGAPFSVAAANRELSADIIVAQENWRPKGDDSVARRAAVGSEYREVVEVEAVRDTSLHNLGVVADVAADEAGSWGLAVLSRLPVISYQTVSLGSAAGDFAERVAQVVEVGVLNRPFVRVVNVHITHRLCHGPGQLLRLLRSLPDDRMPTVIAGDLNMCRPTIYLARDYRAAVRGRTWPAGHPALQLDHVLVSGGIRVAERRINSGVGSDHLPVRVALRIPRTNGARRGGEDEATGPAQSEAPRPHGRGWRRGGTAMSASGVLGGRLKI